jgi:hypothetical protein
MAERTQAVHAGAQAQQHGRTWASVGPNKQKKEGLAEGHFLKKGAIERPGRGTFFFKTARGGGTARKCFGSLRRPYLGMATQSKEVEAAAEAKKQHAFNVSMIQFK